MKAINLLSLLSAKLDLKTENFIQYIEQFGINPKIRTTELEDLQSLVTEMLNLTDSFHIVNNYYVGFMIHQIGKEFDLLRIGPHSVINIELKMKSNEEKMTKQLIQNEYYLKFLDLEIYNFTYVSSTKKLYTLIDSSYIEEVDFSVLLDKLHEQSTTITGDLNELFDPTNYLVSPFNAPQSFIEDKYFLNAQQSTYKREILQLNPIEKSVFIAIKGGSGTGKTLLTYDIAKEYLRNAKKVLIFNCGQLNIGHKKLIRQYNWPIEPISSYTGVDCTELYDFTKYNLIIFDEAQRLYKNKFLQLIELLQRAKVKCIFTFDPDQCITCTEIEDNVAHLIEADVNPYTFELTTVVRHNKEIHDFINRLFDLSRRPEIQLYSNVTIQYFSSKQATTNYLCYLREEGWRIIDYTPDSYIDHPDNDHSIDASREHSDIIGQEFDHVVAVLDDYFYYKKNGKLSTKDFETKPYYSPSKMLYQNINRTRKKLHIVVVNNADVLKQILSILN